VTISFPRMTLLHGVLVNGT